ncbi:uncharacterized protein LOC106078954 isoform X1 [Biomphalaria glabrata]|uniref:Uncharacterized protein LOC106078954 isoform X1 n=1 Tax=Biomphalaria glabrata TaxID=6526 RepID=A0A9W3B4G7_BIOGL|nr:uncharacterized protein LOC106078954 isoform X1 [Biomphalaria glabrata]
MFTSDDLVLSLCDEVWKWRLKESPELASFCGIHEYDDLWDDISAEAYTRREKCVQDFLAKAVAIDISSCSDKVALSLTLLIDDLQSYLKGSQFKSYLMPINYLEGIHNDCNQIIASYMNYKTKEDFQKYVRRLENLPKRIAQVEEALRQGVREEIVQHSASVAKVPSQIDELIHIPLESHELLKPFTKAPESISKTDLDEFKSKAEDVLTSQVFPAFQKLKNYIENEYFHNLRPNEGISSIKDGDQWYQQCLDYHLSCFMTPQQIHDLGLKEVARIEEQILKLAEAEGLGQTLPDILAEIKKRQKHFFTTEEEVLEFVRNLCYNKIRPKISLLFKDLPDMPMSIQPVPDFMKNSPAGFYYNGTPDGSRSGCYYINNHNPEDCLPFTLPALSLHEGEPGHHLQGIYTLAATDLPDFRRNFEVGKAYLSPGKFAFHTAYAEGWGLYSEFLGEELNIYDSRLDQIGRNSFEIFRAARLVVDTGIHALGWSKEKAVEYMEAHTLLLKSEVTNEIDRYITWPGQACAYKIGEIKLKELRQKAQVTLDTQFDMKEFHRCVLSSGSVPLHMLESIVDQFITDLQKH